MTTTRNGPTWKVVGALVAGTFVVAAGVGGVLGSRAADSVSAPEIARLQAASEQQATQLAAAQTDASDAEAERARLDEELDEAATELTGATSRLADTEDQLAVATGEVDRWYSLYNDAYDKGVLVVSEYDRLGARHTEVVARYNALVADYNALIDESNGKLAAAETQIISLGNDVNSLLFLLGESDARLGTCRQIVVALSLVASDLIGAVLALQDGQPELAQPYLDSASATLATTPVSC